MTVRRNRRLVVLAIFSIVAIGCHRAESEPKPTASVKAMEAVANAKEPQPNAKAPEPEKPVSFGYKCN